MDMVPVHAWSRRKNAVFYDAIKHKGTRMGK